MPVLADASTALTEALPDLARGHIDSVLARLAGGEVGTHTTVLALRLIRGAERTRRDGYVLTHLVTELDAIHEGAGRNTAIWTQQADRWNDYPFLRSAEDCSITDLDEDDLTAMMTEHALRYARQGYVIDSVTVTEDYDGDWCRVNTADTNRMRQFRNGANRRLTNAWIAARQAQGLSTD